MTELVLAIDQGTTSTRAIVFDRDGLPRSSAQKEFGQHFPREGWVEHDPEDIWDTTVTVCREALVGLSAGEDARVACIGITNQRETTVVWDRQSGKPVYNAIVWQDRRTASACASLKAEGAEADITERTGLLLDPYFSATKIAWILDNVNGARAAAEQGRLAFGTTDCFLLWRFTDGKVHATDATNAARTLLFNIHTQDWDASLLERFRIPASMLPEVRDCASRFGATGKGILDESIAITGMAGDQHAALVGQACFQPGMVKSTYGTGCFALLNTGTDSTASKNKLLATLAYRLDGKVTYALEGSIFIAGAAVQWLRDGLGIIDAAAQTEALASGLESNRGVYMVPAFTGLGAPHWNPDARGALFGLTRNSGPAELARAALESVAFQTLDLLEAMRADAGVDLATIRVDGGMVANDWLMQFLADITSLRVDRPRVTETTALGAARLAGYGAGLYDSLASVSARWQLDARFEPRMDAELRERLIFGWRNAVAKVVGR